MSDASRPNAEDDLDRLIALLEPRMERVLTRDDARPMSRNLVRFVATLVEWERRACTSGDGAPVRTVRSAQERR